MKFQTKYRLNLHKTYFEKGYNLTNYIKYFIALFGLSSLNVRLTLIFGFVYGIACYFIGYFWVKYGFLEAEIEVGNYFNRFVKEMRKKIKGKSI